MNTFEKQSVAVISTAHLTPETANMLNEGSMNPTTAPTPTRYGWLVITNIVDKATPPDLQKLLDWARKQGCLYLMLDCDADTVDALPQYDW